MSLVATRPASAAPRGPVLVDDRYSHEVRWRPGRRLHHLFEDVVDDLAARGTADRAAVDTGDRRLTFADLDRQANRLARFLTGTGAVPGQRIALLLDDPVESYRAMLAASKAGLTYVPLDVAYPPDRLAFIVADSGCGLVLATSTTADLAAATGAPVVDVHERAGQIAALPSDRPGPPGTHDDADDADGADGADDEELAYIVYTSGSTGRPKGVAISHRSICNFVDVAAEVYGFTADDRVYQGMTIAFDFSVEEIWVPWRCGATVVPRPPGGALLGADLHDFLVDRRVTAMCCVPTLLATIEEDLPGLRFLLVSGEACPQDLVRRWWRDGRRFLNVYGPTEATVTATWTVLHPDRPVTIGLPLPTYSCLVLDPETGQPVAPGTEGELVIGGVGLAAGYVNRPDQDAKAFVADRFGCGCNPSGRLYRTGDLVRVTPDGEIEYLGRIDLQVKIRGYRIELTEIESVLMEVPGVAQAVVNPVETSPGTTELAAYYTVRAGAAVDRNALTAALRTHLPAYMVPGYLDELQAMPMLPSDKADRKSLPAPRARLVTGTPATQPDPAAAATGAVEDVMVRVLADLLGVDQVPVTAHLFTDLGANSLLMARFCARVRRDSGLPLSMRDVYLHPTVRGLATNLGDAVATPPAQPAPLAADTAHGSRPAVTRARYFGTGAAQAAFFLATFWVTGLVLARSFSFLSAGEGALDVYWRAVVVSAATVTLSTALPLAAKWLLVGRFKAGTIPLWGPRYVRFWVVTRLMRISPFAALRGSPLQVLYLRALGARIGHRSLLLAGGLPACPDLLSVGEGTVVRPHVQMRCYRPEGGVLRLGSVTLGSGVVVGENSTLDVDTWMQTGSSLGHASTLQRGQVVPENQAWHGTPARPVEDQPPAVEGAGGHPRWRGWAYGAWQLVWIIAGWGPLVAALAATAFGQLVLSGPGAAVSDSLHARVGGGAIGAAAIAGAVLVAAAVLYLVRRAFELAVVVTVPRLLSVGLRPGVPYPVHSLRYGLLRTVGQLSNVRFHMQLFGDSSYIVGYLRALGWKLGRVVQTGSNFGLAQRHETPYHVHIGPGTMAADGLSVNNVEFTPSTATIRPVRIGGRSFLGNAIAFPPDARTGDDVLYATKVAIPVTGPVREGVGLLGSPAFEIPRSVLRDAGVALPPTPSALRRRLRWKNRHNRMTMLLFLTLGWLRMCVAVGISLVSLELLSFLDTASRIAVVATVTLVAGLAISMAVEHAARRFRPLVPRFCSIYDLPFWRHERYWKLTVESYLALFAGTPFRPAVLRGLGLKVGRYVFDDGAGMPERTLITIGDRTELGAGTVIQCHSLEDGAFKSDRIVIGSDVTLGVGAFIHYGTRIGDGAVIEANSFLMKGEEVPPGARWGGNPAQEIRSAPVSGPASGPDPRPLLERLQAVVVGDPGAGAGAVVVAMSACRGLAAELAPVLDDGDRDEIAAAGSPARREELALGRALLRHCLSAWWHPEVPPGAWRFRRSDSGALLVAGPLERLERPLHVSISHTASGLAVAASRLGAIGVDIEADPGAAAVAEAAGDVLSDQELAALDAAPPEQRGETFARMWTLKEAAAKRLGTGALTDLRDIPLAGVAVADGPGSGATDRAVQRRVRLDGVDHWVSLVPAGA